MSTASTIIRRSLSPSTYRRVRHIATSAADFARHLRKKAKHRKELANRCRGNTGLLLNIGCGPLTSKGWVNLDYNPTNGAFYFDALDPLPLADGSVRHIHCEHFLEHLEFDDARNFLRECRRVLEPNGTVRIIVPDAEKYMRAYCSNDMQFFEQMADIGKPVEPLHPKNMVCNQSFRMGGHHLFGWDYETMEHVATQLGFTIKRSKQYDVDERFRIDGGDAWRPAESLYANLQRRG